MADAKFWNIPRPQRLKVVCHAYFASPVTTVNKFSINISLNFTYKAAPI